LIGAVVALITILVGFLSGLTGGLAWQNVSGVIGLSADRVVLGPSSPGATPSYADSAITAQQEAQWQDAAGVTTVTPLGISQARAESADAREAVAVFGGALPAAPTANGQIVLSSGAARALSADPGDTVTIAGTDFAVTSITADDWYSHTPVVYTTLSDWQSLAAMLGTPGAFATALLVTGDVADAAGVDATATTVSSSVLASLTSLPAFRSEIGSLALIIALLFGISALVVGSFFAVWTMQRRGDVAILKALGATNRALVRDALGQAAVILAAGTVLGMAIVVAAALALGDALPFLLNPLTTVVPAVLLIVLGLVGAGFSLRTITTADPLTALGSNR